MRTLVVLDSKKTDFIFYGIVKKMLDAGVEVGIYNSTNCNNEILERYFGKKIKPFNELDEAIIEYYDNVFCMFDVLSLVRKYDSYVFSYILNENQCDVINGGADFLFSSCGECKTDNAYMQVGFLSQPNCNLVNRNYDAVWIDDANAYTRQGLLELCRTIKKEFDTSDFTVYIDDSIEQEIIIKELNCENTIKSSRCILEDSTHEIIVVSRYANIQLSSIGKNSALLLDVQERNNSIQNINSNMEQDIVNFMLKINKELLIEAEYPKTIEYVFDGENIDFESDGLLSMEELKKRRVINYVRSLSRIDDLSKVYNISTYINSLTELAKNDLKNSEILNREKIIYYLFITENFEALVKDKEYHALYRCFVTNGLYETANELCNMINDDSLSYWYIKALYEYRKNNYSECIEASINYFQKYDMLCRKSELYSSNKYYQNIQCFFYMSQIEDDFNNLDYIKFNNFFGRSTRELKGNIYGMLLKKSSELMKQERFNEGYKICLFYDSLLKKHGFDSNYSKNRYQYYNILGIYYAQTRKFLKKYLVKVEAFSYYIRYICKVLKNKLAQTGLKKKLSKFLFRVGKYSKRKNKELLSFLHIRTSNEKKMLKYQNSYKGKRCFILGNGPSLSLDDLNKLHENGDICFACNKIYKVFTKTEWRPDFYACTDSAVFRQNYYSILGQHGFQKFLGANLPMQEKIKEDPDNILVNYATKRIEKTKFNPRATFIFSGGTVTYVLITLAWMMGFREIYLIGCDHSYGFFSGQKTGSVESTSDTNNDYFMKNYMRPGEKMNVGNLDRSEQGYKIARQYIESHGGEIYNATRGGKLEAFVRADLDEVLNR